jgi:uncharacterized protein involved in exopolysaccharide biosynthesis
MTIDVSTPEQLTKNLADVPPDRGSKEDDEISLLDFLITLAERKRLILAVTTVVVCIGIIASLLLPLRFAATCTILPPQQNSSMNATLAAQLGNLGGMSALAGGALGMKNPNDMFVALMRSRTVEDSIVQRYGLVGEYHAHYLSDARRKLEQNARIDGDGKDGLIRISIEDPDPKRAAELANGYVDQFRDLSEHLAITEASQRRLFFERQLEQAKDNLANAEEALKETEQQTGLIQVDSQTRALIESAASLRAQIAAKEVQIRSLQTFATAQNAQLVQAEQELEGLEAQLAKLSGSGAGSDASLMIPRGKVTEAGLEYVRKLRDVKYYETIFDLLARQYEMAKLDEAKEGALIQVVDPAIPPDRRSSPKRTLIVLGSTVLGLMLGVAIALVQATFERMNEDMENRQKLNIFWQKISFRKGEHLSSQ